MLQDQKFPSNMVIKKNIFFFTNQTKLEINVIKFQIKMSLTLEAIIIKEQETNQLRFKFILMKCNKMQVTKKTPLKEEEDSGPGPGPGPGPGLSGEAVCLCRYKAALQLVLCVTGPVEVPFTLTADPPLREKCPMMHWEQTKTMSWILFLKRTCFVAGCC